MEQSGILNQSIYKTFFKYVSLNVLSMLGVSLYVLADTFFVANGVGADGLVALNLALPVFSLINGTGLLIGIGSATLFSIATGKGKQDAGSRIFTQSFILAAVVGVILTLCGLFWNRPIAVMLGANDEHIISMTATYLKLLMTFSCAFIINNLLVAFVRNDGNPRLAMFGMLGSCLFNIVFDYIFVFPLQLGIFGAALATGVAPILSLVILSAHFSRKKNHFRLIRTRINRKELAHSIFTGIPSFVTEFSSGIIIFLFNMTIIGIAGDIGVAAYGIVANLALVCIAIFTGVGQGIQPVVSVNYGAGRIGNVLRTYLLGAALAFVLGGLFYLAALFFPDQIASIFNSEGNGQLQALTRDGLSVYFLGFLFAGINVVTTSFFASIARPRPSFLLSVLRGFALIIPGLLLLPGIFGLNGVWMTVPLAELLTFACCIAFVVSFFKRHRPQSPAIKSN
ncbi:MATE family efflux transporter [Christensenella intestinihominis]|uniref:MATE family efflux transporter n=1 Tax=Christensenella intestinihominis TaxID=1851429 RepID=UPI00082A15E3|nr:MATE family efflux transporter [Christensenella intestinihominis]